MCSCCSLLSDTFLRGREARERAELVVGAAALEIGERLAGCALREAAADQSLDGLLELIARHAAEERAADQRCRPERAAHEDVVGGDAVAVGVLAGRRLETEIAHPVLRARVRAAVEMKPKLRDRVAERRLEMIEQVAYPLLRLADGEVAVRLAGARDRVRPDLVRVERQSDLRQRRELRLDIDHAGDDQILLTSE